MIFRNLYSQIKNHKIIMSLLFFTQIVSVIALLFFYGVFYNSQYSMNELGGLEKLIYIKFNYDELLAENDTSFMPRLREHLPEILAGYEDRIAGCRFDAYYETDQLHSSVEHNLGDGKNYISVFSEFAIKKGRLTRGLLYNNMVSNSSGWFSDNDNALGKNVCVTSDSLVYDNTDYIEINGNKYQIYGKLTDGRFSECDLIVPFLSMTDNMLPYDLFINFKTVVSGLEYNNLMEKFSEAFGDLAEFEERYVVQIDERATLFSVLIIAGVMIALAAICICSIYKYLFKKNIDKFVIYCMCGARGIKVYFMFLAEILLSAIISAAIGYLLFTAILKPLFEPTFAYFNIIFNGAGHMIVLAAYLIIILLLASILFLNLIKLSPKEARTRSLK